MEDSLGEVDTNNNHMVEKTFRSCESGNGFQLEIHYFAYGEYSGYLISLFHLFCETPSFAFTKMCLLKS